MTTEERERLDALERLSQLRGTLQATSHDDDYPNWWKAYCAVGWAEGDLWALLDRQRRAVKSP